MSVSIILLGVITAVWVKLCHLVYITMLSTSLHHFLNISYFKPKKKKKWYRANTPHPLSSVTLNGTFLNEWSTRVFCGFILRLKFATMLLLLSKMSR